MLGEFYNTLTAVWVLILLISYTAKAVAAPHCEPSVGEAVSVQGAVELNRAGQATWQTVTPREVFCAGDSVRTASRSRAAILLTNQTLIRLDEDTSITFSAIKPAESSWMDLLKGALHFLSRTRQSFRVKTPFVNAAIEGTEFMLRVTPQETALWVYEGVVAFENAQGRLTLHSSEAAVADAGKAPVRRIVVDPHDAVQWALYYPPVIDYGAIAAATGRDRSAIAAALADYRRDDLHAALARLDAVPRKRRSSTYYSFRAGLLLSVGRVDQAEQNIDRALALDPADGNAYALRSIIALVRNESDKALSLAKKGARLDPQSSAPQVALSYAHQARFDIRQAQDNATRAVSLSPENALAWARLSELELSLGELDKALAAARQAATLDPDIARTQTILGFANLTEINIDAAKEAFEKAISLDQAAPLPRLGLGLVTIRAGDLNKGVRELEIAASLDPENSLIRSYLGKGYYEQKREKLAATEFEMAKRLDPRDPTPHFYNAILKQTTNRPVEALHDLQKSIELNDNRAVYRSRLLLDQDIAARTANFARIYDDLGFQQRALLEGWRSVNLDPANFSGHRFLADSYATIPRHEIARASELLQAQLLQPINITPVQPQQAETNLLILDGAGPGNPSFNEYNPLFVRNRAALQLSGVVGTDSTLGDEIIVSGLHNNVSGSLGQFHFETDGIRNNANLRQDLLNGFMQIKLSQKHNLQAEARNRKTSAGDVASKIRPQDESDNLRRKIKENSLRLGYHFDVNPNINLITSIIYKDRNENAIFHTVRDFSSFTQATEIKIDTYSEAWTTEAQYLINERYYNLVAGGGYYQIDHTGEDSEDFLFGMDRERITTLRNDFEQNNYSLYLYSQVKYPQKVDWTLGLSADFFNDTRLSEFNTNQINPKFGMMLNVTPATTLRFAWFRILKQPLAVNQTIQPTQVAGFNQFYDDFDGTDADQYGVGIDHRFSTTLLGGVEHSHRNLLVPTSVTSGFPRTLAFFNETRTEDLSRAYLYWTLGKNLALSSEYSFEDLSRDLNSEVISQNSAIKVRTHRIPLGINYYDPSGLFMLCSASFIAQNAEFPIDIESTEKFDDQFWIVDASIGYRFPKRLGTASLVLKNILDQRFRFKNTDAKGEPRLSMFEPGRSIFVNVSLSF